MGDWYADAQAAPSGGKPNTIQQHFGESLRGQFESKPLPVSVRVKWFSHVYRDLVHLHACPDSLQVFDPSSLQEWKRIAFYRYWLVMTVPLRPTRHEREYVKGTLKREQIMSSMHARNGHVDVGWEFVDGGWRLNDDGALKTYEFCWQGDAGQESEPLQQRPCAVCGVAGQSYPIGLCPRHARTHMGLDAAPSVLNVVYLRYAPIMRAAQAAASVHQRFPTAPVRKIGEARRDKISPNTNTFQTNVSSEAYAKVLGDFKLEPPGMGLIAFSELPRDVSGNPCFLFRISELQPINWRPTAPDPKLEVTDLHRYTATWNGSTLSFSDDGSKINQKANHGAATFARLVEGGVFSQAVYYVLPRPSFDPHTWNCTIGHEISPFSECARPELSMEYPDIIRSIAPGSARSFKVQLKGAKKLYTRTLSQIRSMVLDGDIEGVTKLPGGKALVQRLDGAMTVTVDSSTVDDFLEADVRRMKRFQKRVDARYGAGNHLVPYGSPQVDGVSYDGGTVRDIAQFANESRYAQLMKSSIAVTARNTKTKLRSGEETGWEVSFGDVLYGFRFPSWHSVHLEAFNAMFWLDKMGYNTAKDGGGSRLLAPNAYFDRSSGGSSGASVWASSAIPHNWEILAQYGRFEFKPTVEKVHPRTELGVRELWRGGKLVQVTRTRKGAQRSTFLPSQTLPRIDPASFYYIVEPGGQGWSIDLICHVRNCGRIVRELVKPQAPPVYDDDVSAYMRNVHNITLIRLLHSPGSTQYVRRDVESCDFDTKVCIVVINPTTSQCATMTPPAGLTVNRGHLSPYEPYDGVAPALMIGCL